MKQRKRVLVTLAIVVILAVTSISAALAQDSVAEIPGSGWWTGTQIQNVGSAIAALTVTSYNIDPNQAPVSTDPINLAQNASTTLLPDDLKIQGQFQGSATVSSDQPLRAIVNTTNLQAGNYGIAGGLAAAQYQGVNNPATELNFPLAKNGHFGKTTTFYVQNAGSNATTFQANFIFGGGNCSITTPTIQPNRMAVISPGAQGSCPTGNNTGLGSMKVSSSEPMAGVVLEHGSETPAIQLQATRGFAQSDADTTAYAPIIKTEYFNRFTGLQIQNTTGSPINVTVDYTGVSSQPGSATNCAGQSYQSTQNNLAPNESVTFVHLSSDATNPMPAGCLASATVSATGNVVAIVNEAFVPSFISGGGNGGRQESTTYSAFAGAAGTTRISAPLYKENSFDKGTGLQVQNVGNAQATNVVLTFIQSNPPGNSYVTKPQTIPAGGAKTFVDVRNQGNLWQGTAMPSNLSDQAGVFGVVVEADQPVVAIANESTYPFGNSPKLQDKNNYEGFNLTP